MYVNLASDSASNAVLPTVSMGIYGNAMLQP